MADSKYNGWTNYETWVVNLWMGNEEGSYLTGQASARRAWQNATTTTIFTFTRKENAVLALANEMHAEYESAMHDLLESANALSSIWADLLGAALSEVNWHEIAGHMIEDVSQESS